MKVAIVHDWLTNIGGAERVVDALCEMYPEAPIYTSVYNKDKIGLFEGREIITSFLQHWPLAKKKHQLFSRLRQLAFESFDFSEYDLVISSSSAEAKGIITSTETMHISYIHTPTRYYWSGYEDYLSDPGFGILNPLAASSLRGMVTNLRRWDYAAAHRPDVLVANSTTVSERIAKYYNLESTVVYPPVEIERFVGGAGGTGEYFLVVSRLIPYKRVDILVQACTALKIPLKVVGSGSELGALRAMAGDSVEFIAGASDEEVNVLMQNAKAFLFAANEDFGITPVEAMAAGKPVVAFKEGGATETILDSKTGVFFTVQSSKAVQEAIIRLDKMQWSSEAIANHAKMFSRQVFIQNMKKVIDAKIQKTT